MRIESHQLIKVTLDHNCLIALEKRDAKAECIWAILKNSAYQCFVVNVGASEMQQYGVRPDNYSAFEDFLLKIGVAELPRLDPIGIADFSFWGRAIFTDEKDSMLLSAIQDVLLPVTNPSSPLPMSDRKYQNYLCDAATLWCHIHNGNDIFVTSDENFFKETKYPSLMALDVKQICRPQEL